MENNDTSHSKGNKETKWFNLKVEEMFQNKWYLILRDKCNFNVFNNCTKVNLLVKFFSINFFKLLVSNILSLLIIHMLTSFKYTIIFVLNINFHFSHVPIFNYISF